MDVLIACEFSGVVRDAFLRRGHNAISCDIIPTESPGPHYEGDIRDIISKPWDLMVAHPPCTYLSLSGVQYLHDNPNRKRRPAAVHGAARWEAMREGAEFFRMLLEQEHIPRIAVENPIQHRYAREIIGRKYDQIIHPWQHGHGESKQTCLWLKNLPLLEPTNIVDGRSHRLHRLPPSPDRGKLRSITYLGIAEAMAEQWGDL